MTAIPAALRDTRRWLAWKPLDEKKPPVTDDGNPDKHWNDPQTFSTFEAAQERASKVKGADLGYVLGGAGIGGIDIDHCRNESTGEVDPRAIAIIEMWGSSAGVSPSGTGVKVFGRVPEDGPTWLEITFQENGTQKVEPKASGYFAVTGNVYGDRDRLADLPFDTVAEYFGEKAPTKTDERKAALPEDGGAVAPGSQHDWLMRRAWKHAKRGMQLEDVVAQLRLDSKRCPEDGAPWTERDFTTLAESALRKVANDEPAPSAARVDFVKASDVEEQPLRWLWHARILMRAVALLEGRPERGKTLLLVQIAAIISTGGRFPDEPPETKREPRDVVMLAAEDDPASVLVPRLRAAGADLSRIHILTATRDDDGEGVPFHLSDDIDRLRDKCREVGAGLITVDPLVSYMGSRHKRATDTNNDMQVRKALLPLADLAQKVDAAVLAVRHYRKGRGTDAQDAGGGSVAFGALARVQLAALEDPDDPERHLLAVAKNNNVRREAKRSLAYAIKSWEKNADVPKVVWGEQVDVTAGEVLHKLAEKAAGRGARESAGDWLLAYLDGSEKPASEVLAAGRKAGFSEKTLKRAKRALDIKSRQTGQGWLWELDM